MTPDAALDHFAFLVGLRLMGADARRRLRLALLLHPDLDTRHRADGTAERLERLDALLDGRRAPDGKQDELDVARAERERDAPPFDPAFWLARTAELMGAGFTPQQAARLVQEVRDRVDRPGAAAPHFEEETA